MLVQKRVMDKKQTYDRSARPLCQLEKEDVVWVRCDGQWGPLAKVITETTPRSFAIQTEYGNILRRNRRHLLKVPLMKIEEPENHHTDGLNAKKY